MVTIHDVAEKAGVSTATVSRYLNASGYVSKETGKIIDRTCKELGYSVKKISSKSKSGANSDVIGVIVTEIDNYFLQMR